MTKANPGRGAAGDAVQPGSPHRGRAPDPSRDGALREAALGLLADVGYDRLTMDAVAARAHASKTTIYRRWQDKAELIVDALSSREGSAPVPDTGSLRGDLEAVVQRMASGDNRFDARVMMGMISAVANDAQLRDVFRQRFIEPRRVLMKTIFARAVTRGEIPEERNLDLLVSLFPALMIDQLLITGSLPRQEYAEQVVNDVIVPLATAPAREMSR